MTLTLILHGVMNIIVVPINAESEFTESKESTESKEKPKEDNLSNTEEYAEQPEKLNHWDIYYEMIRISINNPYNW